MADRADDTPNSSKYDNRLTSYARRVLDLATEEARNFNHDYVGSEHLLLGLLREGDGVAARALSYSGIELQRARAGIEYLVGRGDQPPLSDLTPTPGFQRAIELALYEAKRQNHQYLGTEHLLLGLVHLVREGGGIAGTVLEQLGVKLDKVRAQVIQVISESRHYIPLTDELSTDTPTVGPRAEVSVFYSYSHKDERLLDSLRTHLTLLRREGLIEDWHDRKIGGGREWKGEIDANLDAAGIILLLVSPDFLASDYCWDVEVKRAMERHESEQARVIPIILRPVDWHTAPFAKLQGLPKDAKAVTKWGNRDEAWYNIARGIREAVRELSKSLDR